MGKTFENLTWDDLCDMMCGGPEEDCTECEYAKWDYETYYGTTQKQYFVCGCKLNKEPEKCGEDDEE